MSRKAVHHHYASSASKVDPDLISALHSSSGSNASTESGDDETDIKWSDRGYKMAEIVDQFSLPLVVRYKPRGRSTRTTLPLPFSISHENILLFSVKETRHLVASNICDPSSNRVVGPDTLQNDVTIPEDFDGLFVRPHTTKVGSELKVHQTIDSLIKGGAKGFLTLTAIQAIVERFSQSKQNYSHGKISYPTASLFLIEEIQNWSEKFQTFPQSYHVFPFNRSRSLSSNRKSHNSHSSRSSSTNGESDMDDKSSYVIASGEPAFTTPTPNIPDPTRKGPKENEDVWIKTVDDDDVFLLDKPPGLGVLRRSPKSSPSIDGPINSSANHLFAKCKDSAGRRVYFPLSTTGFFIQICTHPKNPKKLSMTVPELLNSESLPPFITFVYGKKLRLLTASGFLRTKRVETNRSVLACALGKTSFVFFEIPIDSRMRFSLSLNKSLLNSPRLRSALRLCENKSDEFATDMKVIIKLSSGSLKREGRGSGSESLSKLEDIAEEEGSGELDQSNSHDNDKRISKLAKDYSELSLEGIIYI